MITEHEAPTAIEPALELLTRGEVARRFGVAPQTVARWARQGILPSVRTLGGQRRYPADVVRKLVSESLGPPGGAATRPEAGEEQQGAVDEEGAHDQIE